MNGVKQYTISINGIQQSIDAVESLNKSLDTLEKRIDALAKKNVNVSTSGVKSGTDTNELKQEEALLKKIDQLHKKVAETEKKEYQELLHAKEELKEYQQIAKAIAAETNLSQGINDTNTMAGMKAQLHDIKAAMQFVDVDSDKFKQMQKDANDLNNRLKEIEQGYGQYGRNVGNYANGVAEGFEKIKVAVGDSTREYDNYRQAVKDLTQERFKLSQTLGRESEEYKKVDSALEKLKSDYKDLDTSSRVMDNLLDTMESFTALASAGVGLSSLFGLEDSGFEETMKKLASLLVVLKSFETLNKQWKKEEGLMGMLKKGFKDIDSVGADAGTKFGDSLFKAFYKTAYPLFTNFTKWLNKSLSSEEYFKKVYEKANKYFNVSRNGRSVGRYVKDSLSYLPYVDQADDDDDALQILFKKYGGKDREELKKNIIAANDATLNWYKGLIKVHLAMNKIVVAARWLAKVIGGIFTGGIMLFLPELLDFIGDFVKSLNTTKIAAERAAQGIKSLNRELEVRRELLSASYLKGEINDEQFLTGIYEAQTRVLKEQIDALQIRAKALQNNASGLGLITNAFDATQNTEFTGKRLDMPTTVGRGRFTSWVGSGNDLQITVNDVEELENAWKQCNEAIAENKNYFDKWGTGVKGLWNSLWATVKDTEEVMRGIGNVRLSDFVARFGEINEQFNKGEISADQYAAELAKLKNEMNDNKILNSVIANLDKYIPDEEVRSAVQNIINEIVRLDDAFNMTSEGQIHYWNQVRIDAMKDGMKKEMAQIQENERHEVVEYGKTQEQINLIHAKYQRQRQNAQDRANKESANKAKEYSKKLKDAENELIAIRIENMKDGLEKELASIENERRLALQKAQEYGKLSGQMQVEINRKYDKKILEEKRKWAFEVVKIYEDLEARIDQVNRTTFEKEVETAERNVSMRERGNIRNTGYEMIQPTNYDDTKNLEAYYKKVYDIQKKALDTQSQIQQESLDKELEFNQKEEEIRHKRIVDENNGEFIQQLRAGKITQEQYNELIERENEAHLARMNALEKEYASQTKNVTEENLKDVQELYAQYFNKIIDGITSDKAKIDEVISQPLIVDNEGWDVVNISKNRANFKKALADYENLKNSIIEKQNELDKALKSKTISAEDFAISKKALDDEMKAINEAEKGVKQSSKELLGNFFQSIQKYVQAVGQAATSIIQSIGEINDAAFEKQMEALEKQTEALEEQLNKQKELTQKYANDVEGIEDELATARGDRRQHLIDQLNAQMAAQRESLAQEKRIEKEQEKLDKKKQKLEEDNNKRKKSQAITTALINAALAISNAAVNTWPIPAVPMMALAAAVGAAQVAAVKAAKYADGGVLQGKSHKQGGIKLLNGYAEAEGGEYITNKRTTAKNVDLLEYINSKKRRVDLSDMIEFYADKPKANIRNISKRYFADGGYVPTLRNDITINDRLINAMEDYSERPVYVEVVDIMNKADNVRQVRTLAGIE